jgi:hypothetical protein
MAIDARLQRPGSAPLKEVLGPALEGQLADVTAQAIEADMERASDCGSPCSCEAAANAGRQQQQKSNNAGNDERSSAPPDRDDYCPGGTRRRMLKDATG